MGCHGNPYVKKEFSPTNILVDCSESRGFFSGCLLYSEREREMGRERWGEGERSRMSERERGERRRKE